MCIMSCMIPDSFEFNLGTNTKKRHRQNPGIWVSGLAPFIWMKSSVDVSLTRAKQDVHSLLQATYGDVLLLFQMLCTTNQDLPPQPQHSNGSMLCDERSLMQTCFKYTNARRQVTLQIKQFLQVVLVALNTG